MNVQEILNSDVFKRCELFHGHVCPGLSLGYKAARAGMAWLKENRSEDEEIVAIVETDACSADAVQVLTGCTFGKGNFIYKDYGKMALTLLSRKTGRGVRLSVKGAAYKPDEEHLGLIQKMMAGDMTEPERTRFQELHQKRSCLVLETSDKDLFQIRETHMELPAKARIEPSESCSRCGEPVMRTKLEIVDGAKICRGCLN